MSKVLQSKDAKGRARPQKAGAEDTAAINLLVEDKEEEQLKEYRPAGVLPEKLGGGVRPASQNPYPIYDQNL